jgi:hypothetical protein
MYDRGSQFGRKNTHAGNNEFCLLQRGLDAVGVDSGQRDKDQHGMIGLNDVNRWLPYWPGEAQASRPEHLTM